MTALKRMLDESKGLNLSIELPPVAIRHKRLSVDNLRLRTIARAPKPARVNA